VHEFLTPEKVQSQQPSLRAGFAYAVGAAIAANPQASLPNIMSGWNEVRAAYRLFAAI
jgi:hypothetical protein